MPASGKAVNMLQNRVNLKFGNHKLPASTAIFNLGAAMDCPSLKLGLCQVAGRCKCYALRDEERFPVGPRQYRRRQLKVWDKLSAEEFADQFLAVVKKRVNPTTAFRINESGDFRHQADVDKMSRIADLLKPHGIKVYGYTARRDLDFSKVSRNLILNGSGFRVRGEFKFIPRKSDRPKGYGLCVGDCTVCDRCLKGLRTCVVAH
jgi:hypothetical protein